MSAFVAYGFLSDANISPPGREATRLALEARMDTTAAAPLAAALLDQRGGALMLDASAVQHLGAQCAQVLLSARLTWAKDGQDFEITRPSDTFGTALRLLGLTDELGTMGE